MNRHVKALSLLLVLQLVVLGGILVWQQRAMSKPPAKLLAVDRGKIDGLEVIDDKGQKLTLRKGPSGWLLSDSKGLPADNHKVSELLDKLADVKVPWPVATSAESAKRFEVAPDKFQREIKLMEHGKVVGDVYLGTSPGFKKVHARRADSNDIYAISFANYDATARADDWLDKDMLKPTGDITKLVWPDHWTLQRAADKAKDGAPWTLDGLASDEKLKQDAATELVNKVANLRIMGVADAPGAGSQPVLSLNATTKNGEFDYQLYRPSPKSDFIVTRKGQAGAFKLAAYVGEPLIKDRSDLISGGAFAAAGPAAGAPAKPTTHPKANAKPSAKPTGN